MQTREVADVQFCTSSSNFSLNHYHLDYLVIFLGSWVGRLANPFLSPFHPLKSIGTNSLLP
jgi:hypothetical protein